MNFPPEGRVQVTRWLKGVGDRIERGEALVEVSTDKIDTELPSPVSGVIQEIHVVEGGRVGKGTPLMTVLDDEGREVTV